jgi:hypothetical protein
MPMGNSNMLPYFCVHTVWRTIVCVVDGLSRSFSEARSIESYVTASNYSYIGKHERLDVHGPAGRCDGFQKTGTQLFFDE